MARLIRLRNLFLYAGLERETFHDLRPAIHKENLVLLRLFSLLGAVMFFLLLIICTILHTTAAADLIVTHGVIVFSMIAAVLTITVMLLIEAKEKRDGC